MGMLHTSSVPDEELCLLSHDWPPQGQWKLGLSPTTGLFSAREFLECQSWADVPPVPWLSSSHGVMWCKLVKLCFVFHDFQEEKLSPLLHVLPPLC